MVPILYSLIGIAMFVNASGLFEVALGFLFLSMVGDGI